MSKILIVGGVAGGASAAARLRRLDEKAEIIMFERGEHISFANCGLPYYIGGVIKEKERLLLQTPESFKARFNVDVRVFNEVVKIDRENKKVKVKNLVDNSEYEESYDTLILSPGAEPIVPNKDWLNFEGVFTLRSLPDTFRIKAYAQSKAKSAVVVGGGYIGLEMAENLHHLGLEVTVIELADHIIAPIDFDVACEAHKHFEEKGVRLLLNTGVKNIEQEYDKLKVTANEQSFLTDIVILAIGVKPETSLAKDAGLTLGVRDAIVVDKSMKTSDENIYAAGDAVEITDFINGKKGFIPLASPANKQGRIIADNIAGLKSEYEGTQGTAIIKVFDMTIAATGNNEKTLLANGIEYGKSYTYSGSHAGYYPNAVNMAIKLLFEPKSGKILGAQLAGYDGVDKRCDVIATSIRANMTVFDLTKLELSYAPPYSSAKDPVNMAGYVASNILNGEHKVFYWNDIKNIDTKKNTLLDVRTKIEHENGAIANSVNIPVDELRGRLDELDKEKPVYIYCQIGLRGYIAYKILVQNGFKEVYNLSGGYRLYNLVNRKLQFSDFKKGVSDVIMNESKTIELDACGLQCPGPIMRVFTAMQEAKDGDIISVVATDPAFSMDIEMWCKKVGNKLLECKSQGGKYYAKILKTSNIEKETNYEPKDGKNIIVFSGDLDKAIAAFIIANGSAAMGRKVSMFFTFWGLNILRKAQNARVKKNLIEKMFGFMMPRGSKKLGLSKMNMAGMGPMMIRGIMKHKNIDSLEELISAAQKNGVNIVACTMSMDVMGIKKEELLDNISYGGVAAMLGNAEESDMSLFI